MKLKLIRDTFTDKSTTGPLMVDDVSECYILEDVVRPVGEKVFGKTAIPEGTYKVVLDYSPKYGRIMPHILDVPNFLGIRIHAGNQAEDTEGCLIVGRMRRPNWVGESKLAYAALFQKLQQAVSIGEEITIEVTHETIPSASANRQG